MPRFTSTKNKMDYNIQVWEIVKRIPSGMVCTYGRIADMIPPPNEMDPKAYKAFGARWVGGAMAQCPDDVRQPRIQTARSRSGNGCPSRIGPPAGSVPVIIGRRFPAEQPRVAPIPCLSGCRHAQEVPPSAGGPTLDGIRHYHQPSCVADSACGG